MEIMTEHEYKRALIEFEMLTEYPTDIKPGSSDEERLETLISAIQKYESEKENW